MWSHGGMPHGEMKVRIGMSLGPAGTPEGFTAAVAVVTALEKAKSNDTAKLIAAMEGMPFDSPRGRMWFRAEDHQAMMPMYHVKMTDKPGVAWAVPELVREIPPEEFKIPVRNRR